MFHTGKVATWARLPQFGPKLFCRSRWLPIPPSLPNLPPHAPLLLCRAPPRNHCVPQSIPQLHARAVNLFYANSLNPYLNFHRPCFFAVDTLSPKGKIVKTYPNDKIMTPWDRLRQIQDLHLHLKPGITELSRADLATRQSDSQADSQLQKARTLLFQSFNRSTKSAA